MATPLRVLILEDNDSDVQLALHALRRAGYDPAWARVQTESDFLIQLNRPTDIILSDYSMPQFDAMQAFRLMQQRGRTIPFIVVSGTIGEDVAVAAMKEGVTDYILKDRMNRLGLAVKQALEKQHVSQQLHERTLLAFLTSDVGLAFTTGGSLRQMLQACAGSMVHNLEASFVRIWTLNDAEQVLELQASAGMYTHLDGPHGRVPMGRYEIGLIAAEKKPHLSNDVAHDPRISDPEWAARDGIIAFAGYPLLLEDRLVGVMAMFARQYLTEPTLQAMAAVANQIALGIERKQTEERLRHLLLSSPAVIFSLKLETEQLRLSWISDNIKSLMGYEAEECMLPDWLMSRVHPEDLSQLEDRLPALLRDGRCIREFRFRHKNDAFRWVRDELQLLRDGEGKPTECVGSWSDITDRKRTEFEHHAVLTRLQLYIERMPLASVVCDVKLRITDWNAAAERTFGYQKEEVLGMGPPYEKVLPAAAWPHAEDILCRLRTGDMAAHSVIDNLTKTGKTITCQWLNTPLMDDKGQFVGLLCLAQDVTEQKSLQAQFQQSQKMEAFGQLAGGVAHDFNNLLTVISGYSEMLLSTGRLDEFSRSLISEIHKAGERAAALTRQLLAFSRKQILELKVLDLNAIIIDTEKMLRRLIGEDIRLTSVLQPGLARVKVDPGQMEQVIMNLVINARDAMPQGGNLTIESMEVDLDQTYGETHSDITPGRYVIMAVSDTGCGMDEATKARMFEPFFTTKGPGKGTGLGLATVFGIAKQSGGYVHVDSELGRGTTFKIYLPVTNESDPSSEHLLGVRSASQGHETILLIEDEEDVRGFTRHALQMFGYTVLDASNGADAIRTCEQYNEPIHLVVSDVVMPEMGGRRLIEQLTILRPGVKVLFLSGYTDDAVMRHGVMEGEFAFLQKPFTPTTLENKVREVLDQTG